ncbi:MAG: hypothetical protein PF447_00370 [Spirochaetaceae bacterium]|jgi:hypothetical protein|nr:hypothetical protein [Spirochaetaceae bacterium]
MNKIDQPRIEDFIKSLSKDELKYMNRLVVERLKLIHQMEAIETMSRYNLGDRVEFETEDGRIIRGHIIKLNKKTVSLRTDEGAKWNVAPVFLRLI